MDIRLSTVSVHFILGRQRLTAKDERAERSVFSLRWFASRSVRCGRVDTDLPQGS